MLEEFSLEGKRALITGGSTGLGRAMGLVFAEAGADVALAARTAANLDVAAEEVRAHGRKVVTIPTDVSDRAAVDVMVATATAELGGVDILVNNAGTGSGGPVSALPEAPGPELSGGYNNPRNISDSLSDDAWDSTFRTNLSGPFFACRAVGHQMLERRYGKIINIASTNAVKMFTKVLAMEWAAFNITVNAILPGWFVTEMTRSGFDNPEVHRHRVEGLPMKRLTSNRDLGLLALYLASPASDWMTGQAIALDGGETALYN